METNFKYRRYRMGGDVFLSIYNVISSGLGIIMKMPIVNLFVLSIV